MAQERRSGGSASGSSGGRGKRAGGRPSSGDAGRGRGAAGAGAGGSRRTSSAPGRGSTAGSGKPGARSGGKPGERQQTRSSESPGRSSRPERSDRGGAKGGKPAGKYADRPAGGGRSGSPGRSARSDESRESRTEEQAKYDGPPLDDSITGGELDRSVLDALRGLPEKLALRVARHLAAAGLLLDEDPATAYQHTLAARGRAARVAVVREACGEAAYAVGEYAEALAELRAARRMNGANDYLPMMADCERALGRPERALTLAKSAAQKKLSSDLQAEMTIVEAGARRDLGELEGAIRTLEHAPLHSKSRAPWVARLRYAYADTLLAAGEREKAVEWFHRTIAVDADEVTDAAERLEELE